MPRRRFSSLPCFLSGADFLGSAPAELPSSRPHIQIADVSSGSQDRPPWAAEGLVLTAASTAATLEWHGAQLAYQHRPSNDVADATSMCVIVLTTLTSSVRDGHAGTRSGAKESLRRGRNQGNDTPGIDEGGFKGSMRDCSSARHYGWPATADRITRAVAIPVMAFCDLIT